MPAKKPAGGWDKTPVPNTPFGYTLKFTFHSGHNLPMADIQTQSSDPYLFAILSTSQPTRHKSDSPVVFRSHTVQKSTEPEWNSEWVVANVPADGFRLKVRVYDEDPDDHDDRLGNVHIDVNSVDDTYKGFKEQDFKIMKRSGSWRAYAIRGIATCFNGERMHGHLKVSIENLGKTEGASRKTYTCGPGHWYQHFSPLIGKLAGTMEDDDDSNHGRPQRYMFEANQLQLAGPVPDELYHRFVEFKPFVKGMFSRKGLRGRVLNRLLHHQHARIYIFDKQTKYGCVPEPGEDLSKQFLKMVHYDTGGRIFTYVLMLDGQLRFTETGAQFTIDLLSKHTMHSDVSQYIACSGEFFIRRLKSPKEQQEKDPEKQDAHPPKDIDGGPPKKSPPTEPKFYELIIDNDSGTYRPDASLLPKLQEYLSDNFKGLQVITKPCDDKQLSKLKDQQRKIRKKEGENTVFVQGPSSANSSNSSLSSSDNERLEESAKKARQDDETMGEKVADSGKKTAEAVKQGITNPKSAVMGWAGGES